MSTTVTCPNCGQAYPADPALAGTQVRCTQCQGVFVVPAMGDPLSTPPLPSSNATDQRPVGGGAENPFQPPAGTTGPGVQWQDSGVAIKPKGPTDAQIRLGAAVVLPLFLLVVVLVVFVMDGMSYRAGVVLGLAPFMVFYSIAGLIDPNYVRAAGVYGKHLPGRYKVVATLVGVAALACSVPLSIYCYLVASGSL